MATFALIVRSNIKRMIMKKQYFLPLLIALVLAAALASHCSKGSSYGSNSLGDSNNNNSGTAANTITMQSMSFSFASLTVTAGTTITWKNNDNTTHTATANDNSFNSGDIASGYSYSKVFNTKGSFPYYCNYHSTMKGTIVVN